MTETSPLPPDLDAAIERGVADGSIFTQPDLPKPVALPVMWRCSCREMFGGVDVEPQVHRHAAYAGGGTHRVEGPIFADDETEAKIRAIWAEQDGTDD